MAEANLHPTFWKHSVAAFVEVRNCTPTSPRPNTTPSTGWNKEKPDVSRFRVFGCLAYVLIPHKAFQTHTAKCIFMGYPPGVKGWTFWNPNTRCFFNSSHVVFDERCFPGDHHHITNIFGNLFQKSPLASLPTDTPKTPSVPLSITSIPKNSGPGFRGSRLDFGGSDPDIPVPDRGGDDDTDSTPDSPLLPQVNTPPLSPLANLPELHTPSPPLSPTPPPAIIRARNEPIYRPDGLIEPIPNTGRGHRRATGDNRPPWNYQGEWNPDDDHEEHAANSANCLLDGLTFTAKLDTLCLEENEAFEFSFANRATVHDNEPKSYAQAMSRPPEEAAKWHQAAVDELNALIENGVFEPVRLPDNRKAIGSRWVFKIKQNADGSIERYKARLVAKGYTQRWGYDFDETFSPTPKLAAIRTVLALAAVGDLELWSVDISSAYLNGELKEEVYMEQPEGFHEKGPDYVWRLMKSLYGLKQAGRQWHKKLHETLTSKMGFKQVKCEHSIWVYQRGNTRIIIPVFVNDMTIAAKTTEEVQNIISQLRTHFKLRDLGPTTFLLGIEIIRDRANRTLTISQQQYIIDLLERVNMSDCNSVTTPLEPGVKLSSDQSPKTPEEFEQMRDIPYLNVLGAVAYLAIATCPDIAYAVSVLSRFNKNPGPVHWAALKRLLRYLKGTINYCIQYSADSTRENDGSLIKTYSDADHGGNPDNGQSTSGYVVKIGGGAVSWSSKLQSFVTLSTTEAEYVAAVASGQEIIWLRNLFTEFGFPQVQASPLFIDNQSALSVARNPDHHGHVKHLDLRFYWL